jgi:hypothetical protein
MDWMPVGLIGLGALTLADLVIFRTVFPQRTVQDTLLRIINALAWVFGAILLIFGFVLLLAK